jgi:hypothetical protein
LSFSKEDNDYADSEPYSFCDIRARHNQEQRILHGIVGRLPHAYKDNNGDILHLVLLHALQDNQGLSKDLAYICTGPMDADSRTNVREPQISTPRPSALLSTHLFSLLLPELGNKPFYPKSVIRKTRFLFGFITQMNLKVQRNQLLFMLPLCMDSPNLRFH